jgi:hypothetical protein
MRRAAFLALLLVVAPVLALGALAAWLRAQEPLAGPGPTASG